MLKIVRKQRAQCESFQRIASDVTEVLARSVKVGEELRAQNDALMRINYSPPIILGLTDNPFDPPDLVQEWQFESYQAWHTEEAFKSVRFLY